MRPARISLDCPHCGLSIESARGVCERHLPRSKDERPKRPFTSRKFTSADDSCKKAIKDRDNWICRRCDKHKSQAQMHAAHIFPSTYKALRPGFQKHTGNGCCLRHDYRNLLTMCAGCHIRWAHNNPHAFVDWVKAEIGEELYEELSNLAHKKRKRKTDEIEGAA